MYKNILVALSFKEEVDTKLLQRANEFKQANPNTEIHLVHAVEQLVAMGLAYGLSVTGELEVDLKKDAEQHMQSQANLFASTTATVELGAARDIILDQAQKLHSDLIIIGSHVQTGVKLLLGSTANTICHAAACDVLAIRTNGS